MRACCEGECDTKLPGRARTRQARARQPSMDLTRALDTSTSAHVYLGTLIRQLGRVVGEALRGAVVPSAGLDHT